MSEDCSDDEGYLDDSAFDIEDSNDSFDQSMTIFTDSLQRVIEISDHQPILVYIYHKQNQSHEDFENKIFSSTEIIKYLNLNYLVWSYEVTHDIQQHMLNQIWKRIFSVEFFDRFQINQCPLLIGILPIFRKKTKIENTFDYWFKILMKNNIILRTKEEINSKILLNELDDFKNEFNKTELDLSFDFCEKTGLPLEILLEIVEYLSFNDAISAFPVNVIYSLKIMKSKIDLLNPLDPSTEKYLSKINVDQVRSLRWDKIQLYTNNELQSLSKFKNVNSITFQNPNYFIKIRQYKQYLPSLTQIHFSYDSVTNYYRLCRDIERIGVIQCLKVSCPGLFCSYSRDSIFFNIQMQSVLFDLRSITSFPLNYSKSIEDLIKCMSNVRSIRIKIRNHHLNLFLDDSEWKIVVTQCLNLKKITLEIYKHDPKMKKYLVDKVQELERRLHYIRATFEFQIILL